MKPAAIIIVGLSKVQEDRIMLCLGLFDENLNSMKSCYLVYVNLFNFCQSKLDKFVLYLCSLRSKRTRMINK